MSTSNIVLKKVNTDISSVTADVSIRKQHRNNTLEKTIKPKYESGNLILLEPSNNNQRKDIYGNIIKKGGNHKVSFVDNPILQNLNDENEENEEKKIIDIVDVESYKEFNKLMLYDHKKEMYYNGTSVCCESCNII